MTTIPDIGITKDNRKIIEKLKEEAKKYLKEYECPACHQRGKIQKIEAKMTGGFSSGASSTVDFNLGFCRNCKVVVVLNPDIRLDLLDF
jgi:RecJ-like exonuclease